MRAATARHCSEYRQATRLAAEGSLARRGILGFYWRCDIPPRMQGPARDEEFVMEEALAAIRRVMTDEQPSETTLTPAEPQSSSEETKTKDAGLLSREATAAIGAAMNTLTETVKKHEPTLEDVVHDALRPVLKSWLEENLPDIVERMVQAEIERITRGR